jgi:hypothetical protein
MTYAAGSIVYIDNYSMFCYFPYEIECYTVRHDAAERNKIRAQTITIASRKDFLLSRYAVREHDLRQKLGNRE